MSLNVIVRVLLHFLNPSHTSRLMHRMFLSDGKFEVGVLVSSMLDGTHKCFAWSFLHGMLTRVVARSFELALGFLCCCKLNTRVVMI